MQKREDAERSGSLWRIRHIGRRSEIRFATANAAHSARVAAVFNSPNRADKQAPLNTACTPPVAMPSSPVTDRPAWTKLLLTKSLLTGRTQCQQSTTCGVPSLESRRCIHRPHNIRRFVRYPLVLLATQQRRDAGAWRTAGHPIGGRESPRPFESTTVSPDPLNYHQPTGRQIPWKIPQNIGQHASPDRPLMHSSDPGQR